MNNECIMNVTACSAIQQSGLVHWPLFDCQVPIIIGQDEAVSLEYAEQCVSQLLSLVEEEVQKLLRASISNFLDVERCHGAPIEMLFEFEGMPYPEGLDLPERILPYIKPVKMYVDREVPGCDSISVFSECAWEPELGLQWVVRNGKALFVGAFQGLGSHNEERLYLEIWKGENYLLSDWGKAPGWTACEPL